MGRKNPHAPSKVAVRCQVCGHEWETISAFPQCADPSESQESCGRSRSWEYVYKSDDPRSPEYDSERWEAEAEHPGHPDNQLGGDTDEEADEPEDETNDESDDEPEGDGVVTKDEYDAFHGERPPEPEPEPEPEPKEKPSPSDPDPLLEPDEPDDPDITREMKERQAGNGLPVERRTLILLAVGLAVVIAIVLFYRKRKSGGSPAQVSTPTNPNDNAGEVDVEASDEGEGSHSEPETDPIEEARRFDRRTRNDIELFE